MFHALLLLGLSTVALGLSTGDLEVSVKALQTNVDSIEDIVISAIVSNPTNRDIRVLAKNNVLDSSTTSSFAVSKDGKNVLFTGIRATYDLNEDGLYTVIPAGSSVAVNHTGLAPLYDFHTHGIGKFDFAPNTHFQTGPEDVAVKIPVDPIVVTVKSDVEARNLLPFSTQTSTPTCSDGGRLQFLTTALSSARSLAGGAASDIRTHPNGAEWNTYFGGDDHDEIWYRMDTIAGDLPDRAGTRNIYCSGDPAAICGGTGGVIAYTLVVTSGGNKLAPISGSTPSTCSGGYDSTMSSNGGILLHELSHATAGTADIIYGCSNTANLSAADKRNNADNYRCMGLAIFHTYNC